MKTRTIAAVAALTTLVALPASAGVFSETIDLGGSTSDGLFGDGTNTVVTVNVDDGGQGLTVVGFAWVLSFEAFAPSWGSEARIDITSPEGTLFTFSGADAGWTNDPGIFVNGGNSTVFDGELVAGDWEFRFYESFDDGIEPDGIYNNAIFVIKAVPAPGALALLGVAGLLGSSRRRRA